MDPFNKIYNQYYPMIYRVAVKMVQQNDIAADIVQDVFLNLYEKQNTGVVITYYSSWLYRATYNKCIDFIKKQSRFNTLDEIKHYSTDEESYKNYEAAKMISRALLTLKPKERFLVVLYSEGLSYKEMAETTEIKFSSIGKMLARTLQKLKKELKEEYYEMF